MDVSLTREEFSRRFNERLSEIRFGPEDTKVIENTLAATPNEVLNTKVSRLFGLFVGEMLDVIYRD